MRRSLRLCSLAPSYPPPLRLARSLPGPARAVRRAPAPAPARFQSVFHANPRAASFPSAVTAPLPPGLPASAPAPHHLLPWAPCPPPASRRAPGLPRPAQSPPTWANGDSGGPGWSAQDPARPRPESRRRGEEVVGNERREGPPARNPPSGSLVGVAGPKGLDGQRKRGIPLKAGNAPQGVPGSERGRTEG